MDSKVDHIIKCVICSTTIENIYTSIQSIFDKPPPKKKQKQKLITN